MATNSEKKEFIRENYQGQRSWTEDDIDVIPVSVSQPCFDSNEVRRVCAYARVSTDDENQTTSLVLQQITYKKMIAEHENWEYIDLYYDEGITGTSIKHRDGFKKMIEDCKAGKIDMIITKSVSRFARNLVDSMATQQELSRLRPPVGVFFETEHIYSLDPKSKMILANLAMFAEWESQNKSEIMNWSIDKRYELGLFLTPRVFGFDKDEFGNLVINEHEANLIRLFYYLFLNGFDTESLAEIADELGYSYVGNKDGWSPCTIIKMLQNEKYCGELRARKTYTPDYLTHLARKNEGNKKQYYIRNHHSAIVSPEIYKATLKLIEMHKNVASGYTLPELKVVDEGALRGYVPIDRNWDGFTFEDYKAASLLAGENQLTKNERVGVAKELLDVDFDDCVVIGNQLFSSKEDMYMTISNKQIAFNLPCMEALDSDTVCMFWNPIEMRMAVMTGREDGRNFQWAFWQSKWKFRPKSICGFDKILFPTLSWNPEYRYRIKGKLVKRNNEKVIVFDLKSYETCLDNKTVYPKDWGKDFGSRFGKILDSDYSQEKFIIHYKECEEIATALRKEEMENLEEMVRGLINE